MEPMSKALNPEKNMHDVDFWQGPESFCVGVAAHNWSLQTSNLKPYICKNFHSLNAETIKLGGFWAQFLRLFRFSPWHPTSCYQHPRSHAQDNAAGRCSDWVEIDKNGTSSALPAEKSNEPQRNTVPLQYIGPQTILIIKAPILNLKP